MKHITPLIVGVGLLSAAFMPAQGQDMTKVKVALAAFQDVNTIHVGIAKDSKRKKASSLTFRTPIGRERRNF